MVIGQHTMKHWASTQASVVLSSGEAEFAGVIRGAGQGLGYQALVADLGIAVALRVWTDSGAAIGIGSRQGFEKCAIWILCGSNGPSDLGESISGRCSARRIRRICLPNAA